MTAESTPAFILKEAAAAGIKVGTDGSELIFYAPRGMPRESRRSFQDAIFKHYDEIIALILAENGR